MAHQRPTLQHGQLPIAHGVRRQHLRITASAPLLTAQNISATVGCACQTAAQMPDVVCCWAVKHHNPGISDLVIYSTVICQKGSKVSS